MLPTVATAFFSLAVFRLPAVLAQFVRAPQDLIIAEGYAGIFVRYKGVETGICELDPDVKSFSGYADVERDQHVFFWFFEARNADPTTAPLTVWINGGPGSSSMIGLFQEIGPCGVDSDGKVYDNPYSWSNVSNIIFIDQPTTVGFSYSNPVPAYESDSGNIIVLPNDTCPDYILSSDTCGTYSSPDQAKTANATDAAAPNFWKTLQGFMGTFPEYSRNEINFATESYGGHYGPIFSEYIMAQNSENLHGAHPISVNTLLIGNGWFDPLIQFPAYYNYTVDPGNTYDFQPFNASMASKLYNNLYGTGNCVDQLKACADGKRDGVCGAADDVCVSEVESILSEISNRDEYDIRELMPDPFPYAFYLDYLNTPDVQSAIGAFQTFSESSPTVSTAFEATGDDSRELGTVKALGSLLKHGVNIVLFHGDADYNCNWLGGEVVSQAVNAPGFSTAGYADISTSDHVVHGQVKQSGGFSFARIYDSGHEVPFYQPLVSLSMFERAITGMDIATGQTNVTNEYQTKGPATSTYREGNSTIQSIVLDPETTYNTISNEPDPLPSNTTKPEHDPHPQANIDKGRMALPRPEKPSRPKNMGKRKKIRQRQDMQ
ncbi:MAG: hypothetical protein M1837_004946 [Sclerophora amabilis]|nr:MAG: hypothetical protein M1837_004946 [Sclerophora amabilis]